MRVKSCWCFDLRTGGLIIAGFEILSGLLAFKTSLLVPCTVNLYYFVLKKKNKNPNISNCPLIFSDKMYSGRMSHLWNIEGKYHSRLMLFCIFNILCIFSIVSLIS